MAVTPFCGPTPHTPRRFPASLLPVPLLILALAQPASAQQLYDFGTAFGRATAVSGSDLLVGEPQNVIRPGRVYAFRPGGSGWEQAQVITASDAMRSDNFGRALSATVDGLLVGAPQAAEGAGAVCFLLRGAGGWREAARVEGSPGASAAGAAVALSPTFAAFVERTSQGERVRILARADATLTGGTALSGEPGDLRFGAALAALGDDALAVCGADRDGALFVDLFRGGGDGSWSRVARATPGAAFTATGGLLAQDPYNECGLAAVGDMVAVGTGLDPSRWEGAGGAGPPAPHSPDLIRLSVAGAQHLAGAGQYLRDWRGLVTVPAERHPPRTVKEHLGEELLPDKCPHDRSRPDTGCGGDGEGAVGNPHLLVLGPGLLVQAGV